LRHEFPTPGELAGHRISIIPKYTPRNKPRQAIFFNNFVVLPTMTKCRCAESGQFLAAMTD
jgi:hypothetical protein